MSFICLTPVYTLHTITKQNTVVYNLLSELQHWWQKSFQSSRELKQFSYILFYAAIFVGCLMYICVVVEAICA